MRKRVYGTKLSRGSGARRALFRSLIRALVSEGSIVTTQVKAKTMKPQAEKMVNLAKKGTIQSRRRVYSIMGNDRVTVDSLFKNVAPVFKDRLGGYTRIIKLSRRRGDAAEMARIEWVKEIAVISKYEKKGKKKKVSKKGEDEKKTTKSKKLRIKLPGIKFKDKKSSSKE